MTPTQEANLIRINAIQHRANEHGMALAMTGPIHSAEQIRRAARALDELIEEVD